MKAEANQYYCRGFNLNCHKPGYLVEVKKVEEKNLLESPIENLPDWIFSRNAIWLTSDQTSMSIRGARGDEIKSTFWNLARRERSNTSRT
jgi:hypothetical protein